VTAKPDGCELQDSEVAHHAHFDSEVGKDVDHAGVPRADSVMSANVAPQRDHRWDGLDLSIYQRQQRTRVPSVEGLNASAVPLDVLL
jgi:hypothetical protein